MEFDEIAEDQSVESHQLMDVNTSAPKDSLKRIIPKLITPKKKHVEAKNGNQRKLLQNQKQSRRRSKRKINPVRKRHRDQELL